MTGVSRQGKDQSLNQSSLVALVSLPSSSRSCGKTDGMQGAGHAVAHCRGVFSSGISYIFLFVSSSHRKQPCPHAISPTPLTQLLLLPLSFSPALNYQDLV